jgi:hypothetical protein
VAPWLAAIEGPTRLQLHPVRHAQEQRYRLHSGTYIACSAAGPVGSYLRCCCWRAKAVHRQLFAVICRETCSCC